MKAKELSELISNSKLVKKNGELKVCYANVIKCLFIGQKVRKEWRGYGNYITLRDTDYNNACTICYALGLKLAVGNDAPRGGQGGEFVCLTKESIEKVSDYVKQQNWK